MEKMVMLSLTAAMPSVKSLWSATDYFNPKEDPQYTEMGYLGLQ